VIQFSVRPVKRLDTPPQATFINESDVRQFDGITSKLLDIRSRFQIFANVRGRMASEYDVEPRANRLGFFSLMARGIYYSLQSSLF
jgi:hypothetical protein